VTDIAGNSLIRWVTISTAPQLAETFSNQFVTMLSGLANCRI
jgi:hypothetical protein